MSWQRLVREATVRLPKTGGRGVLVPGGFVVTAAHCIEWDGHGRMALGDTFPTKIVTAGGQDLVLEVYAAEPVSDVALLGPVDPQRRPADADAFDAWQERTVSARVRGWIALTEAERRRVLAKERADFQAHRRSRPFRRSIHVHLLTLKHKWISGTASHHGLNLPPGTAHIATEQPIEGGMSGGPIVDGQGRLVGVVSNGTHDGTMPILGQALPAWAWSQIAGRRSGRAG